MLLIHKKGYVFLFAANLIEPEVIVLNEISRAQEVKVQHVLICFQKHKLLS